MNDFKEILGFLANIAAIAVAFVLLMVLIRAITDFVGY